MQDFEDLRAQARTEQDFTDLGEWCVARSRECEAKRLRFRTVACNAEVAGHYAALAEHWKELAEIYAEKARELKAVPHTKMT